MSGFSIPCKRCDRWGEHTGPLCTRCDRVVYDSRLPNEDMDPATLDELMNVLEALLKVPGVSPGPRGYEMVSARARAILAKARGSK